MKLPNVILLPQTGSANKGTPVFIGNGVDEINLQFTPQVNLGFTGTVLIESSTAPNPSDFDWFSIATLVFSGHASTVDINLYISNNPWIRGRTADTVFGSISVYMAAS